MLHVWYVTFQMAAVAIPRRLFKGHLSPDFTTRPIVTCANMTKTVFAKMEIAQNPMGRCVRTGVNSPEGRLRWLLLGCKRPQRGLVTAKSILKTSAVIRTLRGELARDGRGRVHMGRVVKSGEGW